MDRMETNATQPRTWGLYWDVFGERLVELTQIERGAKVLDVGTGGGSSLYAAASRVGPDGEVIGIELCEGCFKHTKDEIVRCGVSNAKMLYMDAEYMEFEDASFDYVISGFLGWDDFYDFERGEFIRPNELMSEVYRVLKSGGRVGINGWAAAETSKIMRDLLYKYLPIDSPHRKNIQHWSNAETEDGLYAILSSVGFTDIITLIESYDFIYPSEDEWWIEVTNLNWNPVMVDLEQSGITTLERLKEEAFESLRPYKKPEGIYLARNAVFAIGLKP